VWPAKHFDKVPSIELILNPQALSWAEQLKPFYNEICTKWNVAIHYLESQMLLVTFGPVFLRLNGDIDDETREWSWGSGNWSMFSFPWNQCWVLETSAGITMPPTPSYLPVHTPALRYQTRRFHLETWRIYLLATCNYTNWN